MRFFALHSRQFWLVFLGLALIAAIASFNLMFNNMPLLKVDVSFTREQAVAAAENYQKKLFPQLKTDRVASAFVSDRGLQNYVELEGGGIEAFKALIGNVDAVTNYWKVRRFSEAQEQETIMAFSPTGEPISFWLKVPDKEEGAALDEAAARAIAEQGAREFMGERFAAYKPYEVKMKKQTNGRVDYSFTYEHGSLNVAEARFRLDMKVTGDKLTTLDTFKHIPEAFDQRFNEMRAVNNQISQIASYLMMGLLGLGGLVGGGIWLYRKHQLQWVRGLIPAFFVAFGLAVASICNLPMTWLNYATTESANTFLLKQFATAGVILGAATLFFGTVYAVAEGLSRMAFAHHIRLFDVHRKPVAASPEILGRVLGAYGWAGFFLLYAMLFVIFSSKVMGWWQPTDMDSDPNILASWRPALGPIFTALQAGTWEECLFRAVPLSLAAIIGTRFGIRTPLIIFTLVLQALIFGGAHANYPNLPGYSRLVELFIPAMAFGLVYLRFGLLVGMLTHFIYDLVLMSLPIFFLSDSGLLIDKLLVIFAGTLPLFYVIWARYRLGAAASLADNWRNGEPTEVIPDKIPSSTVQASAEQEVRPLYLNKISLIGIVLISALVFFMAFRKPADINWPEFTTHRADASQMADAELAKHGVKLEGEWHKTITTYTGTNTGNEFVWRESSKDIFQSLVGKYIDTAFWVVTWRKFDGPVELRSESWEAWLYTDGSLHELVHKLPEATAGAKLTREQATAKALSFIVERQWGDANLLEEKSVEETVRPARSDWVVKYIDKSAFNQKNGQAIIKITLLGDEVAGFARGVDVPDEWQRAEAEKNAKKTPFNIASGLLVLCLIALSVSGFFGKHSGAKINFAVAAPWILLNVSASLIVSALWVDTVLVNLQPTMGWTLQIWMVICGWVLLAAVIGVIMLFIAQSLHAHRPLQNTSVANDFVQGAAYAILFAGLYALVSLALPSKAIPQSYAADLSTYMPWLTTIFNGFKGFLVPTIQIVLVIGALRFAKTFMRKALVVVCVLAWIFVSAFAAQEFTMTLINQMIFALSLLLFVELIRRNQLGVALAKAGVAVAIGQIYVVRALYPEAPIHALFSVVACTLVAYGLLLHWHRKSVSQ